MSKTAWIIVGVLGVLAAGVALYLVSRGSSAPSSASAGAGAAEGQGTSAAGVAATIGAGLTSIVTAVVGAASSANGANAPAQDLIPSASEYT